MFFLTTPHHQGVTCEQLVCVCGMGGGGGGHSKEQGPQKRPGVNECTSTKGSEQIREQSCNSVQMACFYAVDKAGFKGPYVMKNSLYTRFFFFNYDMPLACQSHFKRYLTNSNKENLKGNQSKHWLITLVELILM